MSFILTRPASPSGRDSHSEEDSLSAALHAALSAFSNNPSHHQHHPPAHQPHEPAMHHEPKDKGQPYLDIVVTSDTLCLRGTGVDVNPALLSGNVVLHLPEPTSIKEITLQFRGKARLPVSAAEPLSLSSSQLTYIVCNHEWSFLEGDRHHSHTLKAGRHLFPFQLQIGGSLPSSISTSALGGASVQYKLRATAARGGFGFPHRSLEASCPISIMRGFSPEALEYQQTLEIENTWPEKLMYSIMIPHKAWAAGEKVIALVKFSPLVKGARVQHVTTTINETVKLYARSGTQENTRVISSTRHDIVQGKAVCVDEQHLRYRIPLLHSHPHVTSRHSTSSTPVSPAYHPSGQHLGAGGSYFSTHVSQTHPESPVHTSVDLSPLTSTTANSSSSSGLGSSSRSFGLATSNGNAGPSSRTSDEVALPVQPPPQSEAEADMEPSADVVTTLAITVPIHATASHSLEPIQVSHRIRWSIMISNLDGHTSELRCSLPLHILDARLYDEAHAATLQTRRLLLGAQDGEGGSAVGTNGEGEEDEDMELPSYPAHVRDRVANAFLPESAVMRVVNPWVVNGMSPTIPLHHSISDSSSGVHSPTLWETWQVTSNGAHGSPPRHHLPHEPAPGAEPLEWVNTELLLSLGREAPEAPLPPAPVPPHRPTPPSRTPSERSASTSRHGSRFPSRRGSRASSPVRGEPGDRASGTHSPHALQPGETYVHSHSTASRNLHGLFNIAMKPFSTLGSTFSLGSRTASHTSLSHGAHRAGAGHAHTHSDPHSPSSAGARSAAASTVNLHEPPAPAPLTSQDLLHRAFTEVPDYDMASRGFLGGGVTPLDSLRGLPSYEAAAAERSLSDTDLVGMFAAAQQQANHAAAQRARNARSVPRTPEPQPS
ncbi:hypothetical protein OBBRIDRAFT_832355 [Obba rivulosa]|uniref:Arrestin C-terminal-like domain-containing protein n=1 Tax=Obba rivulosa TaxID=1052685 RepID=A0A8E2DQ68_9APHY|nr:hypothetical protein OBBRIDRAFT_832355 [Obba rivulosa]